MALKILTPAEVKQANQTELTRDMTRTQSVRDALSKVQKELNDAEARFNVSLANQRLRWAKEEEEAMHRLAQLEVEDKRIRKELEEARIPIEEEKKKAHDLYIQAEKIKALLVDKIDDLSDREQDIVEREQKLVVRELALSEERERILKLSNALSINLSHNG